MLTLTFIICVLLSVIVAFFVMVKPLFLDKMQPYFQSVSEEDQFEESVSILETLSELETDYKMGKLTKEDFEALSLEYKRSYLVQKSSP